MHLVACEFIMLAKYWYALKQVTKPLTDNYFLVGGPFIVKTKVTVYRKSSNLHRGVHAAARTSRGNVRTA